MLKGFIEQWERGVVVFVDDLYLFASLYLAHFIVWRTLRRHRKENMARRKMFKLLNGGACT
jgi:hypothetical protein